MNKVVFFFGLMILSFHSIGQVDLNSVESMTSWVHEHQFKSSIEGDFDMYVKIETLDGVETLVISNDHGKRKLFTHLVFTAGGTAATLSCQGESNNSLEFVMTTEGHLVTAGMVFVPFISD